jgi:Uma2 family endonuclease
MGLPAEKPRRATRADLEAVPPNKVAELINGVLRVFPRPAIPHTRTASRLGIKLGGPFDLGEGGPGGWHILDEPELQFGPEGEEDVLVPDLAGWRIDRLPRLPKTAQITIAPDWVCEILSQRTEATDRAEKMPIYAREGVRHAWLIHPIRRTLEVFALGADRRWIVIDVHQGEKRVRAEPFEELELDLSLLWPKDEEATGEEADTTPVPPVSKTKRARPKPRKRARK